MTHEQTAAEAPRPPRGIETPSGSRLTLEEADGAPRITIAMRCGHTVVMDETAQEIHIRHAGGASITLNAAGQVKVHANSTLDLTARAVNVHAASASFDGIVRCTTLVASVGVVAPSYAPGAGTEW